MSHGRTLTGLAAWALAGLLASQEAVLAKPLPRNECDKLISQWNELVSVEKVVRQGPDAAKASLSAADIERIKRYLFVEDQLRFRCPGVNLPEIPQPQDAQAGGAGRAADDAPAEPSVPLPLRKPAAPRKGAAVLPAPGETAAVEAFRVIARGAQSMHWSKKQ